MIVNGNYYQNTANSTYSKESSPVDSLATHMNKTAEKQSAGLSDKLELSPEAYAALKEYAPEALSVLGLSQDNPILDEVKEIAKEKYFHFGSEYLSIPDNQDDMISALDVANRYMDALNTIRPSDIFDIIEDTNLESASGNDLESLMAELYA